MVIRLSYHHGVRRSPSETDFEGVPIVSDSSHMESLEVAGDEQGVLGAAELEKSSAAAAGLLFVSALNRAPFPQRHLHGRVDKVAGEHTDLATRPQLDTNMSG